MESKGTTVVASCIHQALTDSHRYTTLTDATPHDGKVDQGPDDVVP